MDREPMTCWICRSTRCSSYRSGLSGHELTAEDLKITDSRYGSTLPLYQCEDCCFIFADTRGKPALVSLYNQLKDPDYEATAAPRRLQMRKLLGAVRQLCPRAATLLDIGAGIGLLVDEAARLGFAAEGIEPSRWAVESGRTQFHVILHEGTFPHPETNDRVFDIITLIDVIEHVDDPVGLLRAVRRQLSPEGIAVIVTPDVGSVAARLLGRRWWHYRLAHVGYFRRSSMKRAVAEADLHIVRHCRASWYFPIDYLMPRLARYLPPLRPIDRLLQKTWVARITIPLNLFDSSCYFVGIGA